MLLLLGVSLYFTESGIIHYESFMVYKEDFKNIEEQKFRSFVNYEQYARVGIRLIFEPELLTVFFTKSDFVQNLEATTSSADMVNVYNPRKGANAFPRRENFVDLSQIIYILGSLSMMYMGAITIRSRDSIYSQNRSSLKNIFIRLLILDSFFVILLCSVYLYALSRGISFSKADGFIYIQHGLSSIFFLNLFFFAGIVIAAVHKYKKQSFVSMLITWVVIIFIVPGLSKTNLEKALKQIPSSEKLDLDKLKTLLDMEKNTKEYINKILSKNPNIRLNEVREILKELNKNHMNNGYIDNKQKEDMFHDKVKELIRNFEDGNLIFPVEYYKFVSCEVSSKGYTEYVKFINHVLRVKNDFIKFYSYKRYESNDERLENFIKHDENIYKAESRLPRTFWKGNFVMIGYSIILFLIFLRINHRKKEKIDKLGFKPIKGPKKFLFLLTISEKKEKLIKELSQGEDTTIMVIPSEESFNEDVSVKCFVEYVCSEQKIDRTNLLKYLKHIGIRDEEFKKKLSRLPFETKKKITCAIAFALDKEMLVIDDFIKGSSRNFENKFLDLLDYYLLQGNKKVVYVSVDIFLPAVTNRLYEVDHRGYKPYILSPKKVSLR